MNRVVLLAACGKSAQKSQPISREATLARDALAAKGTIVDVAYSAIELDPKPAPAYFAEPEQ